MWSMILSQDERFVVCAQASNGDEAVELAKAMRPNVVLLDINIPPSNGFEVAKLIRKYSPGSKILGISMYDFPAYAKRMFSIGGRGYITKNSPVEELVTAILTVSEGETYLCRQIKDVLDKQVAKLENGEQQSSLTKREFEIISRIKEGLTSKEIADRLDLSISTVNIHRYSIFKKLRIKNVAALMNFTHLQGL